MGYNQQQYFVNQMVKWVLEVGKKLFLDMWKTKCTFSMLNFMKDKLHNRLEPNLDTIVWMFVQKFYTHKNLFLSRCNHNMEGSKSADWCCHLKGSVYFYLGVYISIIWTSLVKILICLWVLLTFGHGGWDFALRWAKSDFRLGFNSPSKC